MKKVLIILLAVIIIIPLFACNGSIGSPASASPTEEELKETLSTLEKAHSKLEYVSSVQLDRWHADAEIMSWYFNDDVATTRFENDYSDVAKTARGLVTERKNVKEFLDTAKKIIGTSGTGDFHNALINYYKCLSKYYSLVSELPTGYSKLTFMNKVADYNSECQSACEDAKFYLDSDS